MSPVHPPSEGDAGGSRTAARRDRHPPNAQEGDNGQGTKERPGSNSQGDKAQHTEGPQEGGRDPHHGRDAAAYDNVTSATAELGEVSPKTSSPPRYECARPSPHADHHAEDRTWHTSPEGLQREGDPG